MSILPETNVIWTLMRERKVIALDRLLMLLRIFHFRGILKKMGGVYVYVIISTEPINIHNEANNLLEVSFAGRTWDQSHEKKHIRVQPIKDVEVRLNEFVAIG